MKNLTETAAMSKMELNQLVEDLYALDSSSHEAWAKVEEEVVRWVSSTLDMFGPVPYAAERKCRASAEVCEHGTKGAERNGLDAQGRRVLVTRESGGRQTLRCTRWEGDKAREVCFERLVGENLYQPVWLSEYQFRDGLLMTSLKSTVDQSQEFGSVAGPSSRLEVYEYVEDRVSVVRIYSGTHHMLGSDPGMLEFFEYNEDGSLKRILGGREHDKERWTIFVAKSSSSSRTLLRAYASELAARVIDVVTKYAQAEEMELFSVALAYSESSFDLPILGVLPSGLEEIDDKSGLDLLNPAEWEDTYDIEELDLQSVKLDDLVWKLQGLHLEESEVRKVLNDVAKMVRKALVTTGVGSKDMLCYATDLECIYLKDSLIDVNPKSAVKKLAKRLDFDLD